MKRQLSMALLAICLTAVSFSCAKQNVAEPAQVPQEVVSNPPGDGPICGSSKMWGKKPGQTECSCYAYGYPDGTNCEWFVVDNSVCINAGIPNPCGSQ